MPATPNCVCPLDSTIQAMAKVNNSLVFLFQSMSAAFVGRQVSVIGSSAGCGCTEVQMLKIINDNIMEFAAAAGGGGVDGSISSWAELAAIPTASLPARTIKFWVNDAEGVMKGTQLLAGVDATDTASGIQRADDWPTTGLIWFNKL